jgi:enoyl-CoA hydratase/carnithine racemase
MRKTLETERDGRVMVVRITSPPHNFMDRGMVGELDELTRALERDETIGAVVLTGKPDHLFVTHYDVAEIVSGVRDVGIVPGPALAGGLLRLAGAIKHVPGLRSAAKRTPVRGLLELHLIHDVFVRMSRMDKVFIAAINGPATGGGCELALACDLRYMADAEIAIGLPEMTIGFNPGAGGTQRLARAVGSGRALEMMLEGETLAPKTAAEAGLVPRAPDRAPAARGAGDRPAAQPPLAAGRPRPQARGLRGGGDAARTGPGH